MGPGYSVFSAQLRITTQVLFCYSKNVYPYYSVPTHGTRDGARTSATAYGQSSALCERAPRHRLDADAAPHGSIGTPARGGRASRPAGTRAALGGSAARLRTWGPRGAHGAGRPAARSPSEACPPVTLLLGSRTTGRWLPTATTTSALPHVRTGPFPGGTRAGPGTRGTSGEALVLVPGYTGSRRAFRPRG